MKFHLIALRPSYRILFLYLQHFVFGVTKVQIRNDGDGFGYKILESIHDFVLMMKMRTFKIEDTKLVNFYVHKYKQPANENRGYAKVEGGRGRGRGRERNCFV